MKTFGYLIFAGFFYLFRLFCPINPKKVFGIMTHDGSMDGNVGVMVEYLKEREEGYTFQFIKKADRRMVKNLNIMKGKVSFFIVKPYHLATSRYVLLDNIFLPMAYLRFSDKVRVVQLWHGTGTIKRFGQDVNTGRLKDLERRANTRITHLIVGSEETKKEYMSSFGVEQDKVYIYGSPRTDLFFREDKIESRRQRFFEQYPKLAGKRLVLYAPTFRDHEKDNPKLALDVETLAKEFSEEYVFLLRLHPFVMEAYLREEHTYGKDNVISMSSYSDINTLLLVADYLITDYSSVIFEYCLREKPMIFYAYDLEEFSDHGRGFYKSYEKFVPGPIALTTEAVIDVLKMDQFDSLVMKRFVQDNYQYLDGKSAERIYLHIFKDNIG